MTSRFHTVPTRVNAKTVRAFQIGLLRWYRRHRRVLPWRSVTGRSDPYPVWVSEIMLQQTRVETVKPYYERWLRAFPTVEALAQAPFERIHKLWEGLGYYSRARNLHAAAQIVASRPPSARPKRFVDWLELPGIGAYTAAAIASIAFDECVPVVDGNVARVLARVFGIGDNVKQPGVQRQLTELAAKLITPAAPGDFNQAMMELGALVCLPARPNCPACPLRTVCQATQRGWTETLPNRGEKVVMRAVIHDVALVRRGQQVWLRQRAGNGLLADMWELPAANVTKGKELFTIRHTITNHRITLRVWDGEGTETAPTPHPSEEGNRHRSATSVGRWVTRREAARLVMSAAHRRALDRLWAAFSAASGSVPRSRQTA